MIILCWISVLTSIFTHSFSEKAWIFRCGLRTFLTKHDVTKQVYFSIVWYLGNDSQVLSGKHRSHKCHHAQKTVGCQALTQLTQVAENYNYLLPLDPLVTPHSHFSTNNCGQSISGWGWANISALYRQLWRETSGLSYRGSANGSRKTKPKQMPKRNQSKHSYVSTKTIWDRIPAMENFFKN